MSTPAISIALVTRNRPQFLQHALESWREQTPTPSEIVVSDDSSDQQADSVRNIAARHGARYIRGPQRGLYANRNHAALHCIGSHILSSDDDHRHPPGYFAACLKAAQAEPQTIWCMGEILAGTNGTTWGVPGEMSARGASVTPPNLNHTWAWSDGAALCPRAVFESGCRFYEGFRFGWSYLEFGCLLEHLGWDIRILPDTGVYHHLDESGRSSSDARQDLVSRYFALLMHAFVYQRTLARMFTASCLMGKEWILQPSRTSGAIKEALKHCGMRRRSLAAAGMRRGLHQQKLGQDAGSSP